MADLAHYTARDIWRRFSDGESIAALAAAHRITSGDVEALIRLRVAELRRAPTRNERQAMAKRALDLAAKRFNVDPAEAATSRSRTCTRARWSAWLALIDLGWSQNAVARAFGVDHTSVMYAVGAAPEELGPAIEAITTALRQGSE